MWLIWEVVKVALLACGALAVISTIAFWWVTRRRRL